MFIVGLLGCGFGASLSDRGKGGASDKESPASMGYSSSMSKDSESSVLEREGTETEAEGDRQELADPTAVDTLEDKLRR